MKPLLFISTLFVSLMTFAKTEVSFLFAYDPDRPDEPATSSIIELARSEPEILPRKWGGIVLPGAGGRATFMLALAGGTAPDIYKVWFHILRHDVDQGFIYPLDEWLGNSIAEKDLWDKVRCHNGHVWALPAPATAYYGIVYRKDLVAAAGLDCEKPPRTWSEFSVWCEKLSVDGRRAFAMENRPWGFLPWVQSAGGDVIRKKTDGSFEACFDCEEAVKAAKFIQSLIAKNTVRALPVLTVADDVGRMFSSGEIVSVFGGEDLVRRLTETLNMPPETIGLMPFPAADDGGSRVLQAHRHFYAMSESAGKRPKEDRNLIFKCLQALTDKTLSDKEIIRNVEEGRAAWCLPSDLERLGYRDEIEKLSPSLREMYDALERGEIKAATEPWVGFWQAASDLMQRKFLGLLLSDYGKTMDVKAALSEITAEANRGLMFDSDKGKIVAARPYARAIIGIFAACVLVCAWLLCRRRGKVRRFSEMRGGMGGTRRNILLSSFFLAPAIISILLWSYYPLIRGAVMAFQEYRIVGDAQWAGLDNFIRVVQNPSFWVSWLRTLQYVLLTLAIGFLSPVFLAFMLCEIPKGKVFFRFLFFLPHLTSALVVTLLWKLMFDPTENGILNSLLLSLGMEGRSWLQDPSLAMVCCILPGAWAGAGISSLIYIAALDSLPKDYYEAAALDGAGIFGRIIHITLPQLAPLMIINFVGAFIAAFQGIGSIFLLTFGGPGDATEVLSLQIWKEAYNNLRFSVATTMAWFLGIALIGWTYLQIKLLGKVEFRQAGR